MHVVAFSNVSFRISVILFVCVSRVYKRTPLSRIAYLTCRCRRSSSMASTPRRWTRCKLRRSRTIRSTSAAWPGPCAGESMKHAEPDNMNIWNKPSPFPTLYQILLIFQVTNFAWRSLQFANLLSLHRNWFHHSGGRKGTSSWLCLPVMKQAFRTKGEMAHHLATFSSVQNRWTDWRLQIPPGQLHKSPDLFVIQYEIAIPFNGSMLALRQVWWNYINTASWHLGYKCLVARQTIFSQHVADEKDMVLLE